MDTEDIFCLLSVRWCIRGICGGRLWERERRLLNTTSLKRKAVNSNHASSIAESWDDPAYCELACCLQFLTVHILEYEPDRSFTNAIIQIYQIYERLFMHLARPL